LKTLSDGDYLARDRGDYRQTWKNVSLHKLGELADRATPTPEDEVIAKPEQADMRKRRYALARQALDKLTKIQRRRYVMYHARGISFRKISAEEGVAFQVVARSISGATKKIKKYLSTTQKMG
jgi:DNA-directed RNA polymerase specialized sigma24 family protein